MQELILSSIPLSSLQAAIKDAIRAELGNETKASVPQHKEGYLTRKAAAGILNISLPTLHEWTLSGKLPAYRIGSRVLYKKDEIDNALKRMRVSVR
ncbi:helix-turn-helix domain-containing protein [Puia sp. P3]|uniref:helix-turn-helix domain-containing protein n=1 Tax=Puia sp. P3 TaxID=3423952 RepID=UPI003D671F31